MGASRDDCVALLNSRRDVRLLIIFDTASGAIGGTERNTLAFACAAAAAGHSAVLVEVGMPVLHRMRPWPSSDIEVVHIDTIGWENVSFARWEQLLDEHRPDRVVYSKAWADCISWRLDLLLQRRRIPYLCWEHHPSADSKHHVIGSFAQHVKRVIRRTLHLALARRVVCVSEAVRTALIASAVVSAGKISVIYPGVDLSAFHRSPERRKSERLRWRIPDESFVIGTVGRLVPHKRNDLVIDALAALKRSRPSLVAHCIIGGTGPAADALKAQVEQLGLADYVVITGWQEDIVGIWNAIDVFPFPSEDEGLGMVIAESVACGCIPLVGSAGGMPEVLGREHADLLLAEQSATYLAEKLSGLIELSIEERTNRWRALRDSVTARFDADRQWARMVEWAHGGAV